MFSNVWLCFLKCHRKHIFYLLLTFSQLPNEYIISFIPQNTNKTKKKNHQIWTNKARSRSARPTLRAIVIGAMLVMSTDGAVPVMLRSLLSLSLSLSLFYFPRPEVIWSENGNENDFPLFWLSFSVNWKCFSVWPNLK